MEVDHVGGRWTSRITHVIAVALAGILLVSLSACGNSSSTGKVIHTPTGATTVHAAPTPTASKAVSLLVAGQHAWYVLNSTDGTLSATIPIHHDTRLPVIDDGATYFTTVNSGVAATNLADGSPRWRFHFTGVGSTSDDLLAAVDGAPLYAATNNTLGSSGALYALSTRDGHELWHVSVTDPRARPVVAGGVVYLAEQEDEQQLQQILYAFRASDGSVLWHAQLTNGIVGSLPTVAAGVVYITTTNPTLGHASIGSLYALRVSDGSQLWKTSGVASVYPEPLVANGSVYVHLVDAAGAFNGHLVALDAATGDVQWQTSFDFELGATSTGLVYGISPNGSASVLTALDSGSGAIRWVSSYASSWLGLTFASNVLYDTHSTDANNTDVAAFFPDTGSLLWRYHVDDVLSPVVVLG
jgi:outer membrane protein assembly factor BamB